MTLGASRSALFGRRFLCGALLALSACAPALRPPQPLGAPSSAPAAVAAATAAPQSVDALLTRAAERYAARPDPTAVADSQALYVAAANADEARVEGPAGAAAVASWRIEHTRDATERDRLLASALDAAQWCGRRAAALAEPQSRARFNAECDYRLAIALGQQAREHPSTVVDALARMVDALRRASAARPELESGGPDRVLALVLLRAPGWPAGPGDAEAGLDAARRAVALAPDFPPNQLALAEALAKNGMSDDAALAASNARDGALASSDPDASEWIAEADAMLRQQR